jgi:hypothetical protein
VEWPPEQLSAVCDFFRADSENLLAFCGKSPDFWDLEGGT